VRVSISPSVIFEELEGEVVLLHLEGGMYYKLNGSGTRIWSLIQQHEDVSDVVRAVTAQYHVEPDVAERDVAALVKQLEEKGLVTVERA
jgi:Coenzyme PQQ synthesis protein D (PqqD)